MDGFQASATWYCVIDVTRRLLGLVGAVRSRAVKAGELPNKDTSTTRIAAARLSTRIYGLNISLDFVKLKTDGRQMRTQDVVLSWPNMLWGINLIDLPLIFIRIKILRCNSVIFRFINM